MNIIWLCLRIIEQRTALFGMVSRVTLINDFDKWVEKMKAQVLKSYDDDLTASSWVEMENVPDPKIEKASDVIVRIGGAGVCRTDLHIIEGV